MLPRNTSNEEYATIPRTRILSFDTNTLQIKNTKWQERSDNFSYPPRSNTTYSEVSNVLRECRDAFGRFGIWVWMFLRFRHKANQCGLLSKVFDFLFLDSCSFSEIEHLLLFKTNLWRFFVFVLSVFLVFALRVDLLLLMSQHLESTLDGSKEVFWLEFDRAHTTVKLYCAILSLVWHTLRIVAIPIQPRGSSFPTGLWPNAAFHGCHDA